MGNKIPRWPLFLIAAPAAVAIWSGWVGLGGLCGFGEIHPLPGLPGGLDQIQLNTAITLPVGIESYGAYALAAWLVSTSRQVRGFAMKSALGALSLGMGGQIIYHLLTAAHAKAAPWPVIMLVSCLPVATLALASALFHLMRTGTTPAPADTAPDTTADTAPDTTADTAPDTTAGRLPGDSNRPGSSWPSGMPALPPGDGPGSVPPSITAAVPGADSPSPAPSRNWPDQPRQHGDPADLEAAALAELSADPHLSGAGLARRLGVAERRGQRLLSKLAPQLPGGS